MARKITNIQVQVTTRDRLAELGSKKDTYDDIIRRVIHQRDIFAIHEICKDMSEFNKDIVQQVFEYIEYNVPKTYTSYKEGEQFKRDWESEDKALNWAMEMAQDEDFIGNCADNVPVSEIVTNVYCLLEEIPAPTWSMSLQMKNPFSF